MHRSYCKNLNLNNKITAISSKNEISHIKKVLRQKEGDSICIFDGKGTEIIGKIISSSDKLIKIETTQISHQKQKAFHVTLACAIPKKSKFELIIEKCTELGVDRIIPLKTKRTEFYIPKEKYDKKLKRYEAVSINASKQSNRKTLPEICQIMNFKDALSTIDNNCLALIGSLSADRKNLKDVFPKLLKNKKHIICFIGPEGDFTNDEMTLSIEAGCIPVSLGETVLKVDTAAISAISYINLSIHI